MTLIGQQTAKLICVYKHPAGFYFTVNDVPMTSMLLASKSLKFNYTLVTQKINDPEESLLSGCYNAGLFLTSFTSVKHTHTHISFKQLNQ